MIIEARTNAELPVRVEFNYEHDEDPRYCNCDIEAVYLFGTKLNESQLAAFIKEYGMKYLVDLCNDQITEIKNEAYAA